MKIKAACIVFAVGMAVGGCETTGNGAGVGSAFGGLGNAVAQTAVAMGTQAALGSSAPAVTPVAATAVSGDMSADPLVIAAVQQQAARQGIQLTPQQAAAAVALAQQQQAAGGKLAASDANASLAAAALANYYQAGGANAAAGNAAAVAAQRQAAAGALAAQAQAAGVPLGAAIMAQGVAGAAGATGAAGAGAIAASQPDDGQKSCEQIAAEIAAMNKVVADANSTSSTSQLTSVGLGLAKTFGGYFGGAKAVDALQAANAVDSVSQQQKQAADLQAQQAQVRLQVLSGISAGKGC